MRGARRWAAVVAAATAAGGLTAGGGAAAEQRSVAVQLGYSCGFPSGVLPVAVLITATFPGAVAAGAPVQPSGVAATLTLPPAALADLTELGAAAVAARARLSVSVTADGKAADAAWADLAAPTTAVPAGGELAVTAAGPVPAVTVPTAGEVTFAAGDLAVVLAIQRAGEPPAEPAEPAPPAALPVACALEPGQDATLAAVPVTAQPPDSRRAGAPGGQAPAAETPDGQAPGGDPAPAEDPPFPEIPPRCGDIPPIEPGLLTACTFVAGRSNVTKLGSAMVIEAGLLNIALANFEFTEDGLLLQHNLADLPAGGFPPATATFLTFGFMPIRATMELTQTAPIRVEAIGQSGPPFDYWLSTVAEMSVRIVDVAVNGVPLEVGPGCRSAVPMHVELVGGTPQFFNILFGGPLEGIATIPPFSGCGVTEDLDPLFTGTVSGPDNYLKLMMGTLCAPADPFLCPPIVPPLPE